MTDPTDPYADRVRALLNEAVSDVEPRPALDTIRARTKVTPMTQKRSWMYAALGAVAATAATVAAVVVLTDGDSDPANGPAAGGTASVSPTPTEPEPSQTATPTSTETLPVYYVGDTPAGPRLYREFQRLEVGDSEAERVNAALRHALTAGTALDPDYRSDWPQPITASAEIRGEEVWIDLSGSGLHDRPASMTEDQAAMAVEQVIHTAHAVLQRRAPVQLTLDGERTDQVLGVGASEPLTAGDPMQVQATVWIISPQEGDEVSSPFTVEGRGAFFEANVSWQLFAIEGGSAGELVDEGFTMADEGMTLSPYSLEVEAEPGEYLLRVYDADMSDGEGPGEQEDTKRIVVR